MIIFRYDPAPPTTPGTPVPQVAAAETSTSYEVKWAPSAQPVSGMAYYEIQERGGPDTSLASNVLWRPLYMVSARNPTYFVGSSAYPGEVPRPQGQFFYYRVRGMSNAGVFSQWSALTAPVATGLAASLLSGISNYPNPFDTRKGGIEGKTVITYILGDNADVEIVIYDLLGYVVKEFKFNSGVEGGRLGANFVTWDGTNGLGNKVSKGGYIARIKVNSPRGNAVGIRKIGVIH